MSEQNYANVQQQAKLMKYISDNMKIPVLGAGGGFAPIGTLNFYDGTLAPQGWLICDGTVYNIADYPELASHYASHHGASNFYGGDGVTTFAVPDLRGEFLRGVGANSHTNQGDGANLGVHQDATEHINIAVGTGSGSLFFDKSLSLEGALNTDSSFDVDSDHNVYIPASSTSTDFDTVYTSRPTNTSFLICVKATLSDAEINAFNVYTPREHQVAWWEEEIDGVWKRKPVYEKTWKYNKTSGETVIFDCNNYDIEHIFVTDTHTMNSNAFNGVGTYYNQETDKSRFFRNPDNKMVADTGTGFMNGTSYATFRYTKTTDDWQTS